MKALIPSKEEEAKLLETAKKDSKTHYEEQALLK